jgi:hypothetical protein
MAQKTSLETPQPSLAIHDLFAIVQVFVVSAGSSQNDMTSAASPFSQNVGGS